jgi:hypothetical protein
MKSGALSFAFGRRAERGSTCAARRVAFDHIELRRQSAISIGFAGGL